MIFNGGMPALVNKDKLVGNSISRVVNTYLVRDVKFYKSSDLMTFQLF